MRGPHTILLAYCQKMKLEGITVRHSSNYAFLAYDIQKLAFKNLKIEGGWDGIHIRGAKNIKIQGCHFSTGDDGIAGGYWDKMQITHCESNSSCNGIRMIQPSTNLLINHCHIYGPLAFLPQLGYVFQECGAGKRQPHTTILRRSRGKKAHCMP